MKKVTLLILVFSISLLAASTALGETQMGTLIGPTGSPLTGFSNVYVVNGVPQPVYNSEDHQWYSVFIVGTNPDGSFICNLGGPLGTDTNSGAGGDGGGESLGIGFGVN